MEPRMKIQYNTEIAPSLMKKFGYKSVMQIPKLDKVVINVGCGESKNNAKEIEAIVKDLGIITGQKAVICKLTSSSVRARTSALRSPCAAPRCTSSWTVCSAWLCPASATSAASTPTPSTAAATTPSV